MNLETKKHIKEQIADLKPNTYDIVLGMSGGVDSTYSLITFLKEGKKVLGIYLDLFDDEHNTSEKNSLKAKKMADRFNIDFKIIEAKEYFKEKVQEYFADTYIKAMTPNPCGMCNREIKIAIFYEIASILNASNISTGHYCGIGEYKGYKVIKKGVEPKKEQSYFLSLIPKEFLEKLYFPLSEVKDKEELRKYLIGKGIMTSESSSDSQDICFLQNGKHAEFVTEFILKNKEDESVKNLKDLNTKVYLPNNKIYNGKKIFNYTVGQRKGLGISYDEPLYVKEIISDEKENKIILDTKENMYENEMKIKDLNLFIPAEKMPEDVSVKIRYSKTEIDSKIKIDEKNKTAIIYFNEEHIKGAKGQICGIYKENFLLGGGIIC